MTKFIFAIELHPKVESILKIKHGKYSEVANVFTQGLIWIFPKRNSNPQKINKFTHAHRINSMSKIKEVNGYMRLPIRTRQTSKFQILSINGKW